MRILQGSKIATQAAQLPLEIVESERHCSPQQIAGINDLPVVLSAAETLRICGKGNTGKTGGPKKQPLPILCIEFIMNLCACVSQVYIIALMSYLPSCMIHLPGILKKSGDFHEDFAPRPAVPGSVPRWNPSQRLLQFVAPQKFGCRDDVDFGLRFK